MLFIDDGRCTDDFDCGLLGHPRDGGLGKNDSRHMWEYLFAPCALIRHQDGMRLLEILGAKSIDIPEFGTQYYVD